MDIWHTATRADRAKQESVLEGSLSPESILQSAYEQLLPFERNVHAPPFLSSSLTLDLGRKKAGWTWVSFPIIITDSGEDGGEDVSGDEGNKVQLAKASLKLDSPSKTKDRLRHPEWSR